MPRLEIGERSERWSLSMLDSILFPKLRAKHKKMSQLIKKHYDAFDTLYEQVAKVLDEHGVHGAIRTIYRAYAERLYKAKQLYTDRVLEVVAFALTVAFTIYGCDWDILVEVARKMNIPVGGMLTFTTPKFNVKTVTQDYEADDRDCILVDASEQEIRITLPEASNGAEVYVKKIDSSSNTVWVLPRDPSHIDDQVYLALTEQYESVHLMSDGKNWFVVARLGYATLA